MAKKYTGVQIVSVNPGILTLPGNVTTIFKESSAGVPSTSFSIESSNGLDGQYSVTASSYSSATNTTSIMTNAPFVSVDIGQGYITNCSVYNLETPERDEFIILNPKSSDNSTSLEFVGRSSSGWGETIQQNILSLMSNFSSPAAPTNPVRGQLWFDEGSSLLKIYVAGQWQVVNQVQTAPNQIGSFVFNQQTPAQTWTIQHNLNSFNLTFTVLDTSTGTVKPILPSDVTFTSANVMTIQFSSPKTGSISIVRAAS